MDNKELFIIDENINNTLKAVNEDPTSFRIKDYVHNLPLDYTNDLIYAIYASSMKRDANLMTRLTLSNFQDPEAGDEITNEKFNKLYAASKEANPDCKNGYLPLLFSYIQLVGGEEKITEEENDTLISQIVNKIEKNENNEFPKHLYTDEEFETYINSDMPKQAPSFLKDTEEFYKNILENENSKRLFSKVDIDSTLNQYLDDFYALSQTDDKVNEIVFYKRKENQFEIESYETKDVTDEVFGDNALSDVKSIRTAIKEGLYNHPVYENGNYDFSYLKNSIELIASKCDKLIEEYNQTKDADLAFPTLEGGDNEEYNKAEKMFVASYIAALYMKKNNKGKALEDPERIIEPNLKINLLKANEYLYQVGLESDEMIEELVAEDVEKLIEIAEAIAKTVENSIDLSFDDNYAKENDKTQYTKDILRNLFRNLDNKYRVYLDQIDRMERYDASKRKMKESTLRFNALLKEYNLPANTTARDLINVIDAEAKEYITALNILKNSMRKIVSTILTVNNPNLGDFLKDEDVKSMRTAIDKKLKRNNIKNARVLSIVEQILDEALTFVPDAKTKVNKKLDALTALLKTSNTYILCPSKVAQETFAEELSLGNEKYKTSSKIFNKVLAVSRLTEKIKLEIGNNIYNSLSRISDDLNKNKFNDEADTLDEIAEKFDKNNSNCILKDGIIEKNDKTDVKKELRSVVKAIANDKNVNKQNLEELNELMDIVPKLIDKLYIEQDPKVYRMRVVDFILDNAPDYRKKEELKLEIEKDIKNLPRHELVNETEGYKDNKVWVKYRILMPEDKKDEFDTLWAKIPRLSDKEYEDALFREKFRNLIKDFNPDKKLEYQKYFNIAYGKNQPKINTESEKDAANWVEFEKNRKFAIQKIAELMNEGRENE